jgi:hypothetical protein
MSAAGARALASKPIERRWSRHPWGIEIQTWRLVETRTLPAESTSLPLSALFDDEVEVGAVPSAQNDDADTLETPVEDVTRENHIAPYDTCDTEKP